VERVYQIRYSNRAQARLDIVNWIEGFYSGQRLHSSIGYHAPVQLEVGFMAAQLGIREIEAGSMVRRNGIALACPWHSDPAWKQS
jgi:hypothetical protein